MTRRQSRTVSVSLNSRGQTTQDFAVGIGIFLIAVASVFSTVPSLLSPYDSAVGAAERNQADRLADTFVDTLTESTDRNELEYERFNDTFVNDPNSYQNDPNNNLTRILELRVGNDGTAFDRVNVTLETLDGDPVTNQQGQNITAGQQHDDGQPSMSAARIVTVDDETALQGEGCDPACRLVVRVW